jgi:hypothetical protein
MKQLSEQKFTKTSGDLNHTFDPDYKQPVNILKLTGGAFMKALEESETTLPKKIEGYRQ